ncbi:hypothetical protein AMECASPLE_027031 [Ameca splendens]|uniref:Uncharacterized protein n=1 Tax=Ameca splendens TaxID=208324 RepID=A0ABV1A1C7_9TELE
MKGSSLIETSCGGRSRCWAEPALPAWWGGPSLQAEHRNIQVTFKTAAQTCLKLYREKTRLSGQKPKMVNVDLTDLCDLKLSQVMITRTSYYPLLKCVYAKQEVLSINPYKIYLILKKKCSSQLREETWRDLDGAHYWLVVNVQAKHT